MKTRKVRSLTPLDGIALPDSTCLHFALGPAGQLGLAGCRSYLWPRPAGWRTIPDAGGTLRLMDLDFGPDGTFWGFGNGKAFRMNNGAWKLVGNIQSPGPCVRLGEGFFTWNDNSGAVDRFKYVSRDCKTHKPLGRQWDAWSINRHSIRLVNGRLYGVFHVPERPSPRQVVAEITPNGLLEKIRGDVVGIDIAGNGFVKLTFQSEDPLREVWKVELTEGDNPPDVVMSPDVNKRYGVLWTANTMRDSNGHVWVNQHRWDGNSWQEVIPDNAFTFHNPVWGLSRLRTRQAEPGRPWRGLREGLRPIDWDPTRKTGWRQLRNQHGKFTLEMIDLTTKGEIRTVRGFPVPTQVGTPKFQCPAGQWWGRGPGMVYRLADGKCHEYADGSGNKRDLRYGDVLLSPKGNVWMRRVDGEWVRWDSKADTFVPGDMYEDHAFKLGPLTMSVIFHNPSSFELDTCGAVFVKRNGQWELFKAPPFDDRQVLDGGFTRVHRGMVYGQRMLLTTPDGVMEYDAEFDRWVGLHDYRCLMGGFDDADRRILFSGGCNGLIYVYDGDPFSAMKAHTEKEQSRFESLLTKMDDDQWRVRDAATREMRTLCRKCPRLLVGRDRKGLSVEVRLRLDLIAEETRQASVNVSPSLFSLAVPSLPSLSDKTTGE